MQNFAELLTEYMARVGISDAELARSVGVRRQTIFRWKEGLVSRPRHRDDVLRCARKLRLTPEERDALLLAAGFRPEDPSSPPAADSPAQATPAPSTSVVETVAPRVRQPARPTPSFKWVAVVAVLLAVAILAVAIWLTRSPTTYPVAGEGETLIVVGRFVNYAGGEQGYNVAGRIRDVLERESEAAQLAGVRVVVWPEEIPDEAAAEAAKHRSGAAVVIWGEYDIGRVLTRFTFPGSRSELGEREVEQLVATPSDLSATINSELPAEVRYVALLTLGQLYADAETFDQARMVLTQALDPPPEEPDAQATLYFRLGYLYQVGEPSDLDRAIDFYSRVAVLQPGWLSTYYNRGIAYLRRGGPGDLDRAIEDLTQVVEAVPDDAITYNNRGTAYLRRDRPGDLARAVEDFSRAIDLTPDAPEAYFNRGLAYVRQGKRERWLEDLERVLALDPDHAGAHNALCWAYALDQQPDLALPYCDRAVMLDPTGFSYDSRGIVYAELGRFKEAFEDLEAFLSWLRQQPESTYERYGPKREAWLEALKGGRNPIDPEALEQLRRE